VNGAPEGKGRVSSDLTGARGRRGWRGKKCKSLDSIAETAFQQLDTACFLLILYVEDSAQAQNMPFSVVMTYTAVGHTVKAHAALTFADSAHPTDKITLFGMFYNDDYLQLSYHNENLMRKQLGVVVLGLTPDGAALKGYYTGFSPRRATIVAGTISLNKKA
jgi:hypothetical protein